MLLTKQSRTELIDRVRAINGLENPHGKIGGLSSLVVSLSRQLDDADNQLEALRTEIRALRDERAKHLERMDEALLRIEALKKELA